MDGPFVTDFEQNPGQPNRIRPSLVRLVAPNASPMTFTGTNTYLLGQTEIAVIDPGPDDPQHLEAILKSISKESYISTIFITHSHYDHSGLAKRLAGETGARIVGFGNSLAGRTDVMNRLAVEEGLEGGEGVDSEFAPTDIVGDGARIDGVGWTVETVWTPGHFGNHLCFAWTEEDVLFSGDHLMAWSTTLISPPDGDVSAFRNSLRKLERRSETIYYPGHGPLLRNPRCMIRYQAQHRAEREAQIVAALKRCPASAKDLAAEIYTGISERLLHAAERNVLAHLIDLYEHKTVAATAKLGVECRFILN